MAAILADFIALRAAARKRELFHAHASDFFDAVYAVEHRVGDALDDGAIDMDARVLVRKADHAAPRVGARQLLAPERLKHKPFAADRHVLEPLVQSAEAGHAHGLRFDGLLAANCSSNHVTRPKTAVEREFRAEHLFA